ncbi:hypothetical protein niasHT_032073 [Heterodera trifolii]|uniref:PIF1/LRR1 pleckstrin homology domain-containing protein n=1 Tax=Heterodera trifolii TaxID=157864 RepID=A0ABD2IF53_9BILA
MVTRLKCVFRVENDGKAMGRSANGFVAFGCERKGMSDEENGGKVLYLLLTTRLNKGHPRKIKLNHFYRLFDKMKHNGMATIQFADPNLAVYVSQADPKALCQFLLHLNGLLRHAVDANIRCSAPPCSSPTNVPSSPPPIATVSTVHRQCTSAIASAKPTKICIQSRQEYQSMIRQASSANLQRLDIVGIGFRAVDIRWFGMRRLQQLSLAANKLGSDEWCTERNWRLFCAISKLEQLNTLDLSQNEFKHFPEMFIDALPVSIVSLNLASNRLVRLTNRICRLQQLGTLRLDHNPLEELPEDLCLINSLCHLSLVGLNRLHFLPPSLCVVKFSAPRFNLLDISGNEQAPFITGHATAQHSVDNHVNEKTGDAATTSSTRVSVTAPPALCEFAAASVLNNKKLLCPGSCLLRPSVADCLPTFVGRSMRQWLRRCAHCHQLFTISSLHCSTADDGTFAHAIKEQFKRVDLRRCAISFYGEHAWAFCRVQLCKQCIR